MSDQPTDESERIDPREVGELLKLQMPIVEPEGAERIAERDTERIEVETERLATPDKWVTETE